MRGKGEGNVGKDLYMKTLKPRDEMYIRSGEENERKKEREI